MRRYLIGFIAIFGLVILMASLIFHGGGKPKPTPQLLESYATTDAIVRLTIDGPINADQTHQQIQIIVSNNSAIYEQIQGYQGNVVNQKSYANNVDAYTNFLTALRHAGFTRGTNNPALKNETGYCPLGSRYIFELQQNGQDVERFWSTSCGSPATYIGNVRLTLTLFQAQIPDFSTLAQNLSIST